MSEQVIGRDGMRITVENDKAATRYTADDFRMLYGFVGGDRERLIGLLEFINNLEAGSLERI